MQLANRAGFTAGAKLPYDAEVEYLDGAVGAYIDIGTGVTALTISFRAIGYKNYSGLFGFQNDQNQVSSSVFLRQQGDQTTYYCTNGTVNPASGIIIALGTHTVTWTSRGPVKLDGATLLSYGGVSLATEPMWIFGARAINTFMVGGSFRIYSASFTSGGTVHPLQPARVGSGANAVGYMYDSVSGQLLGSAGTGAFGVGPDK